jgi:acetylornithine deacetylase
MNAAAEVNAPAASLSPAARSMIERLIAFNTVSRDSNLGLIEWVRDYLQSHGATTRLTHDVTGRKANLFATLGDSPKPGLILSGHTDVVPVDGQQWNTDPFVASEHDGKLYARGSADMKGFIGIALAQAPQFVAALNSGRLEAPLHYALSYDEEVGCLGVRGLIKDLEDNAIRPAGCVVGEPTSMQPIIAHKGTHRFRCRVLGREAHSSYVTHGVNAIEYASRLIVYIRQVADRLAQIEKRDYGFTVPYSTLSTGLIRGGIAANVIPKDCEFQFDMRTLP